MRRVFRLPVGRRHIAREVDDELAFHLEMRVKRLVASGWAADAARAEALRQFGDVSHVREDCVAMDEEREQATRRSNAATELRQDVAYSLRTLRHNIGFTSVIVAALALGIGANTAIFTMIEAVLVRALPVRHPSELVAIGNPARVNSLSQGSPRVDLISYPLYNDIRAQKRVFSGVVASGRTGRLDARIDAGGELEHPRGRFVSGNYFSVLGVPAAIGRTLSDDDDQSRSGSPVATISHGYWTRRFHDDPSVVGRAIVVDDARITIVGVAAPSFSGDIVGASPDLWLPVTMQDALRPHQRMLDDRNSNWLLLLGRLAPGTTLAQATPQLEALITRTIVANAPGATGQAFLAGKPTMFIGSGAKGFSRVRMTFQAPLVTLMIGVGLLLCIICANVATLLLARAIARGREMAVRLALGASRARLVRQLLTESLVLGLFGAAAGLVAAWWTRSAVLALVSGGAPAPLDLAIDTRVLAFTLAVSVFAVVLFGLVPALRASRVDLASSMRAGSQAVTGNAVGRRGQRAPLGRVLIAGQVALSIVLLVGAAMLVRSLRNIESMDTGLDRDHLIVLDVDAPSRGYQGARLATLAHTLRDRIAAIPGVAAVTYSVNGIFSGDDSGMSIEVPGFSARVPADTQIAYDLAGPAYLHAIGARLLEGRDFVASDEGTAPRVALVNHAMASLYFPNGQAVGRYFHINDSIAIQIVGVVADVRDHTLLTAPEKRAYFPYAHTDTTSGAIGPASSLRVEIRTTGDPSAIVGSVRRAVITIDSSLPIDGLSPLTALMSGSIVAEHSLATLATAFGVLALVLAAIGLYGVMTYAITRRTSEIGLRVALGARKGDIVRLVLVDALRLVGAGVAVGIPIALAATRLLQSQLHDVRTIDPISIGVAVAVLGGSTALAVMLPALRAARVSPIVALRSE